MNIVVIKDKIELLQYKQSILDLFRVAYAQELSDAMWDWAYIQNPFGSPYVALAFDDGLVAHYAVIPYPLSDNSGFRYESFLSMTTMVAPSHRKYGLFTTLATAAYDELRKDNADWVMGFPNQMSAPGFRKRLGWEVLEPDCIVSVDKAGLMSFARLEGLDARPKLFADLSDQALRDWRLSKPGIKYVWNDRVAYKEYNGQIDVMYYQSSDALQSLPAASIYNLLVPQTAVNETNIVAVEYMFGGVSLNKPFFPDTVRRQMCISDVF